MAKRLFVGTLLADRHSQSLSRMKDRLAPQLSEVWHNCKLRWVRPEKLHITWLFIGESNEESEQEIKDILASELSTAEPFSLHYDRLEIFGPKSRPKALVLSCRNAPDQVQALAALMRKSLGHLCQKKEDQIFRPHLTLCRFPHGYRGKTILPELETSEFLPLQQEVACLSLIESHLGGKGDSYERLADYFLCSS